MRLLSHQQLMESAPLALVQSAEVLRILRLPLHALAMGLAVPSHSTHEIVDQLVGDPLRSVRPRATLARRHHGHERKHRPEHCRNRELVNHPNAHRLLPTGVAASK